jgi:hypothetical protein
VSRSWARTAVAVLGAFLFPGLGHLFLREWVRGLLWAAGMTTAAAVLLEPPPESMGALEGALTVVREAPPEVSAALFALVVLNAVDAALLSRRDAPGGADGPTDGAGSCPSCGKDLDEDLDFCPWCTTPLDRESDG